MLDWNFKCNIMQIQWNHISSANCWETMLICFIIPGFGKNVEDKYDEDDKEEKETLVDLQDSGTFHPLAH